MGHPERPEVIDESPPIVPPCGGVRGVTGRLLVVRGDDELDWDQDGRGRQNQDVRGQHGEEASGVLTYG
jgi:hypothetical protein